MNQAPPQEGVTTLRVTILLAVRSATAIRVPDGVVERLRAGRAVATLPQERA